MAPKLLVRELHIRVLSMRKMAPLTDYFSHVITEERVAASFRSEESEKTVKQPMGKPRKCLLESNGHARANRQGP